MIEDFATPTATHALSSIPLQFLVYVFKSNEACDERPEFTEETRAEGSCIGIPPGGTYFDRIIVRAGGPSKSIVEVTTSSPPGFIKSSVAQYAPQEYYVNVTWTPTTSQIESKLFCFTGLENSGITTDQRCVTLLVGVAPPQIVSLSPTGEVLPDMRQWNITFDKQFVRPTRSSYIRIHRSDGKVVFSVNVAITAAVLYPVGSLGRMIQFTTSVGFTEKEMYYVTMDPGVAKGVTHCGAESPSIRDPNTWSIKIKDITPPVLSFVNAPSRSGGEVEITWTANENVTAQCTLQTPSHITGQPCNMSWTGTNMTEGYHSIYVQITDLAGNTAPPVRHSWFVDLTPPLVIITSKPGSLSNQGSFTFRFDCRDTCSFECAVALQGSSLVYSQCNTKRYTENNLQNRKTYVFGVRGTDDVGNQGNPVTYTWKVDLLPPTISNMATQSVDCTSDLSPSALGTPSVSDNEGANITLNHQDIPGGGCSFHRKWTAKDQAGNSASKIQVINLNNPSPPTVIYHANATIACGSFEEQQQDMRDAINVTHPCDRPVTITHVDSVPTILCASSFTRTWTIVDDCGSHVSVQQKIRILSLQLPDYPKNGQVNLALGESLRWPQYPGSVRYKVYLWRYSTTKPSAPTAWTYYRRYSPYSGYPADTRMLWRIEYVLSSGALIPSPIWGFQTRAFPDFKVEKVLVPSNAFSGLTFEVSWIVRNIGKVGNALVTWYDSVYIGKSTNFRSARFATSVPHREILFQNDAYTAKGTVQLRVNEFGVFYVFLDIDRYNRISDIDRSNNMLLADGPVQVSLTPPPNLKVEKIVFPSPSFSGKSINIAWTVKNYGMGVTAHRSWYDRVYLSKDDKRDWSDWRLATFYHHGLLAVGASYNRMQPVTLPNAIFGNFSILVTTDLYNDVYEHNNEDDNLKAQEFKILLSPPPDLVVSSITTLKSYYSGDSMKVQFIVSNEGLGEPFHHWWRDRVTITHIQSMNTEVLGRTSFSGLLPPLSTYTRTVYHAVPPSWPTGQYNITVYTDYYNDVFEFTFNDNNEKTVQVNVTQRLPDLTVTHVNASTTADTVQAYVRVSFSVKNIEAGDTKEAPWYDTVYVSPQVNFIERDALWLGDFPHRVNLASGKEYNMDTGLIRVSRDVFGERYVHVRTNAYGTVTEQNVKSNIRASGNVTLPLVLPDLVVTNFTLVSANEPLISDSQVLLNWTVENKGTGSTLLKSWHDTVYLSSSPTIENNSTMLTTVFFESLAPGRRYNHVSLVKLPLNITGTNYLVLKVNEGGSLVEKGAKTNNLAWTSLKILPAPLPDLAVVDTSFVFEEKRRFLTVYWFVANTGSWMRKSAFWLDRVIISPSRGAIDGKDARVLASESVTAKLDEQQEYGLSVALQIDNSIRGKFYVHAVTNANKSLSEVPGVLNNVGVARQFLFVPPPHVAKLILTIISSFPSQITLGTPFPIAFRVQNVDFVTTKKTSWTDALYSYGRKGANRTEVMEKGTKLKEFPHIGALAAQSFYEVRSNVSIPHGFGPSAFIYGFADIHSPYSPPDINIASNVTQLNVTQHNVTQPTVRPTEPTGIILTEGLLPDLQGSLGSTKVETRGGQPLNVSLNVTNKGEFSAQGAWYNALYLSQDLLFDPFDLRLATVRATYLSVNDTLSLSAEVFIPFDTLDSEYYLLLVVDSKNTIWESDEQNNEASLLIKINKTFRSDLAVVSVSSSSAQFYYGEDVTVSWKIRNNGSRPAEGYKCDTVYLSQDELWQIEDVRIGKPICSYVILDPYNAGAKQDTPYSITSKVPLTSLGKYRCLVKTRSNIIDQNHQNNIAFGPKNVNVSFPRLPLDGCTDVTLKPGEDSSYIIDNVPDTKTLIVTINGNITGAFHDLFVRHSKPATAYQYDGGSKFAFSADQEVVIPETIAGEYYILMRRYDTSSSAQTNKASQLCARIAKFEIRRVFPNQVAPLGKATLRFEGTLFGQNLEAFLVNASAYENFIRADQVYRLSSSEVYATFITTNLTVSATFHVKLVNAESKEEALLERSLVVTRGEPGRLDTHVDFPEVLPVDSPGVITLSYENVGDTDILCPLLSLSVSGGQTKFRPVQKDRQAAQFSSAVMFLAQPIQGPGGILPPKAYGEIVFDTESGGSGETQETYRVQMLVGGNEPHAYINSSKDLKPEFLSDELWSPVWDNFLVSVGRSASSFQRRMSAVSTLLSMSGRRVNLLTDLVQFQLDMANGKLSGDPLLAQDDLNDQSTLDGTLPLLLQRTYSPLLSKRRDKGVFGIGWMAWWWEAKVTLITPGRIKIVRLREELLFEASATGLYMSLDGKQVTVNDTELHFVDSSISTVFIFDSVMKHLKKIQRGNETITIEYLQNRSSIFKHSSGGKINVKYNDKGLLREARLEDGAGNEQRCFYTYDWNIAALLSVTVGEQTTRYTYSLNGDLTSIIYPTSTTVKYSWNQYGLLSNITGYNRENKFVQGMYFSYDWNGKVTMSRLPQGDSAVLVFNEDARMMDIVGGGFSGVRFDSVKNDDQVVRIIKQGEQVVMKRMFNKKTNTMSVVDANDHKTDFLLRENWDVLNTTDPEGFVYQNIYDNKGKMIKFKYPDGESELTDYDGFGRLVKFTGRAGKEVKFEYDEKDRIVKKDVDGLSSSYFLRDGYGNIIQATNDIGAINIVFDREKRPSTVSYPNGQKLSYKFNNFQRRVALKISGLSLVYKYDRFNRLSEVVRIDASGRGAILLKLEYNSRGMLSRRVLGNGGYSAYVLDSTNFKLSRMVNYFPNGSISSYFEYNYDSKGRIIQLNTTSGSWHYKYDAASQLIEWTDPQGKIVRCAYDKRGNRVFVSQEPGNKTLYAANEVNQYSSAGSYDIKYDMNGNMEEKTNREVRNDSAKFKFSAEDFLVQAETPNKRCNFVYDGFGNLYKKTCGRSEVQYIIDPFGNPGADVVGQISGGNVTYFVHCEELGLVALVDKNGNLFYYEFDGLGSVVGVLGPSGDRVNRYSYDPFGRMLEFDEALPQDFTFIGQWGVTADRELKDIFWMRSRHYDAQLGRFLSFDPLGFSGKSINLYSYAANNPVMLEDPRGRCVSFVNVAGGPVGAVLGAGTNVAAYITSQKITNKEITFGGLVSSAVTGAVSGFFKSAKVAIGFAAGMGGSLIQQKIDNGRVSWRGALEDGVTGAISSALPSLGGTPSKSGGCRQLIGEAISDFNDKTIKNIFVPYITKGAVDIVDFTIAWVRSLDPNDMIGPPGYGDARFISLKTPLNYKIRFENDPNATAPAQHVIILHKLDQDLDIRTFRITGFGFGNFTKKLSNSRASLQETIDLVSEKKIYLRVIAGIDIMTREARWEFQSLDPQTGEAPDDPRTGFLPPNNGTTGQGYVTFSVRLKKNLPPLARIDAKASIYFDKNEPIDTPPIFNTIDSSTPSSNISVINDVMRIGKLAVDIDTRDEGSGVRSVDLLYQISEGNDPLQAQSLLPLLSGITDDTTFLPLPSGKTYSLLSLAVDHVGNRQPMDLNRVITVDFTPPKPSCERLNNCSGHGNCSVLNLCVCEDAFYGVNCSLDFPLRFETPIIDAMYSDTSEDMRAALYLSSFIPDFDDSSYNENFILKLFIDEVPDGFTFNKGNQSGNRVTLEREEFGDIWMTPHKDFSGVVRLNITAQGATPRKIKMASNQIEIKIKAIADIPFLNISVPCYHWNSSKRIIPVTVKSHPTDLDGSENLTIIFSGLPNGYRSFYENVVNGRNDTAPTNSPGWFISFNGTFKPFVLNVIAIAKEKSNGDGANKTVPVNVPFCVTCEAVNNCSGHGKCSKVNTCECKSRFKGLDCSSVSCEEVGNCSGHGNCTGPNICVCESGFKSVGCSQVSCELVNHCSDHGACSGPNVCSCHSGFKGAYCSEVSCEELNNCANHGICTGPNKCTCEEGFRSAPDCSKVSCELLNHCLYRGNCSGPNVCSCHSGFKGLNCSQVTCEAVKNCSNHGTCAGPNLCSCERGFHGADCSEELQGEGLVGLSKVAVVGISIGSFAFGLLLCMIPFYCYWKREARSRRKRHYEQRSTQVFENQAYAGAPLKS
ncbi:uncharacterized protein [Montipora foliosa]|uniref:uncharacterized protein isoform X1 n=1 Tax=Montipora foliosa TaxID=591990 RepID=UPI0035F19C7D